MNITNDFEDTNSNILSKNIIIGIIAGIIGVVLLLTLVLTIVCIVTKRKKASPNHSHTSQPLSTRPIAHESTQTTYSNPVLDSSDDIQEVTTRNIPGSSIDADDVIFCVDVDVGLPQNGRKKFDIDQKEVVLTDTGGLYSVPNKPITMITSHSELQANGSRNRLGTSNPAFISNPNDGQERFSNSNNLNISDNT